MTKNAETKLLDTKLAAAIAGVSPRTFERKRVSGTGPRFIKLGKSVRYRVSDIEEWLTSNEHTSTSSISAFRQNVSRLDNLLIDKETKS